MQTIDIHTHLLNPAVQFKKIYDRLGIAFFARSLGFSPLEILKTPFKTYAKGMVQAITESRYVKKVCLFPVDSRFDYDGKKIHRDNTVCSHTEDVLKLWRQFPDSIIPFLSVNPLRPDALELVEKYYQLGCQGAKFLQNYWGVDLNNEKLVPYYKKLKSFNIPLLIHTGSEFTVPSYKEFEGLDMVKLPLTVGVTVIAAHMASGQISRNIFNFNNFFCNEATFDRDYFTLLDMLRTYPNLYADIAAILSPMRARILRHLSQQHDVHHKILFGTDYPVPFSVKFTTCDLLWKRKNEISKIINPFDRYISVILEYFSKDSEIFTNYQKVLKIV